MVVKIHVTAVRIHAGIFVFLHTTSTENSEFDSNKDTSANDNRRSKHEVTGLKVKLKEVRACRFSHRLNSCNSPVADQKHKLLKNYRSFDLTNKFGKTSICALM